MPRTLLHVVPLAICMMLSPSRARAQAASGLNPGARVRIVATALGTDKQEALVLAVRKDEIDFQLDGSGDSITVSRDQLTAVDHSVGKRGWGRRGMAIGALAGIATSAALAIGYEPQPCDPSSSYCETKGGAFIAGSVYLGLPLAMLGGVIGLFTRTDRWVKLPPEGWTSRVSFSVPNARTASVHITF